MSKIVVVVEGGIVSEVLSTIKNVEVEVIDLDTTDPDEEEENRERYDHVSNLKSYKSVY